MPSQDEKLELLRRNEVRTMEKDLSALREEQARAARERIAGKTPSSLSRPQAGAESSERAPRRTILPKPPTAAQKILVRAVAVITFVLLVLSAGFLYWRFFVPRPAPGQDTRQTPGENASPSAKISDEPSLPASANGVQEARTLLSSFANSAQKEGPEMFTAVLEKQYPEGGAFPETSGALFPLDILEELENPAVFLLSRENGRKHVAMILTIRDANRANSILPTWEADMENDLRSLFGALAERGEGYVPFFRTLNYGSSQIRYKTLSAPENRALSYGMFRNKLIIASSVTALQKAADQEIMGLP